MSFEDHFSSLANTYARFRPRYPQELFVYLSGLTSEHRLAMDCATGSGQAAAALAQHFQRVAAFDASASQVRLASPGPRYCVAQAEAIPLASHTVDLLTAAQAVHWFEPEPFYREVRRLLRPGGILAVWGYNYIQVDPAIDPILDSFIDSLLGPYWSPRMRTLFDHYRSLPFPFSEVQAPEFQIETTWSLDELLGFINSWSAVKTYREAHGRHPLEEIYAELLSAWGDTQQKRIMLWPLYLRVGRV
jgi:ubiquinone/menaquinone biosynthesis C-methylase UbiE